MEEQTFYMLSLDSSGKDHTAFKDSIRKECEKIKVLKADVPDSAIILFQPASYWKDLNGYNPVNAALAVKSPKIFLHGGRDYQVTEKDFNMWRNGLTNTNAEFKLYPDLNHFFIKGTGKSTPSEYNKSANVDYDFIKDMARWIQSVKK
jgi:fermentation-respiration switch protein FrsA (DUF1100 family)